METGRDEEREQNYIEFISRRDGVERTVRIDRGLVTSGEFRSMARNQPGIDAFLGEDFALQHGEDATVHTTIEEVLDALYNGSQQAALDSALQGSR